MLKAIVMLILIYLPLAEAKLGPCPKEVMENDYVAEAFDFLRPLEGRFQLGSCKVELQVCDQEIPANHEEGNHLVADLLVTDKEGFQRYIPFYVNEFKNNLSKQIIFHGDRVFAYRFRDWNQDPASGKFERWDIEIFKKDDLKTIDYMEVGYNSEVERIKQTNKYWISCGTEFENYIKKHPVRYRVRSWWWWMTHPRSW